MAKKVFELAKELDLGAIELVEKLRDMGLQVRNHMSSLSDDELAKAMAILRPVEEEEVKDAKKPVRRKSSKKSASLDKSGSVVTVIRKSAKDDQREDGREEPATPSGSEGIEVKAPDALPSLTEALKEQLAPGISTESSPTAKAFVEQTDDGSSATASPAAPPAGKSRADEKRILRGLRVVAMPEKPKTMEHVAEKTTAPSQGETVADKKEYLKQEKMFSFSPVYIPPASEKKSTPPAEKGKDFYVSPEGGDDDSKDKLSSKKRLGDLAAMVAKPKKARDITQIRADEELKTYTTDLIGRVVYRNVGRKKIWEGPSDSTKVLGVKDSKRVVGVHKTITAEDLAHKLKVSFREFQAKALELNLLVIPEDHFGLKLADRIAGLYGYRVEDVSFDEKKIIDSANAEVDKDSKQRNPIITIMGHVDHGKTTLLDTIRKTKVASSEAGGITQHIGAYSVKVGKSTLTFLDTPGHAAFGAMRQRGANVTDIVVLVVAADDGVMPQTRESIRYAQSANCPIIVAVNKIDKEGANPDKIKQALIEFELTPEEWGGQTQYVQVSALKNQGIDELLECIALQAEMMELKANPKGSAKGVVIESRVETGRGPMATILIQEGTLNKGDTIVVGECFGRARSLTDTSGVDVKSAGPSTPVQILGLNNPPNPGDILNVVKNEREATKIVENRVADRIALANAPAAEKRSSLEDFFKDAEVGSEGQKILKLVVRSDVQGSYEAIKNALEALGNAEVAVQVIGGGVGPITDTDVKLASSSKGYIIGFNMRPVTSARKMAEEMGVDIKSYSIIYNLIDEVTQALEGLLEPEEVEVYIGRAEVRDTFSIPKIGTIAGSAVIDGKIQRGCQIRLLRDGKIIFDGKLSSLKRFKDDVREVQHGYECGIGLENYNDVKVNDIFEAYQMEKKTRKLELAPENRANL